MPVGDKTPETKSNSTAKLLRVLEAVSEPSAPHRLSAVVARTGLTKTSVHRLLAELIDNDYVSRDATGRYRPARALTVLAAKVSSHNETNTIHSLLTQLQREVGSTVHFALRTGDKAVYIDTVEGHDQSIRMASRPGVEIALHSTAIGKAILANLPEAEVRRYAKQSGLPGASSRSLTTLDALTADLEKARARHFAIDDQENEDFIRCIAVPLFDQRHDPIGGISISTVATLVAYDRLTSYVPNLLETADQVAAALAS